MKTLLALSVNAFSLNPPKKVKQKKLTEYLHEIAYPLTDQDTVEILKRVEEDLSLQNRQNIGVPGIFISTKMRKEKRQNMQKRCSIYVISLQWKTVFMEFPKHYDPEDIESCREWFKSKLKDYWESFSCKG